LGSLPKKGGKKNPGINLGQPALKGQKKKNLGINRGQPARKGRKKKTLVLTNGSCCAETDLDFKT
jgi:hypothetical protein